LGINESKRKRKWQEKKLLVYFVKILFSFYNLLVYFVKRHLKFVFADSICANSLAMVSMTLL
jgi:hypothetical protein